jgi:hypothetical protein
MAAKSTALTTNTAKSKPLPTARREKRGSKEFCEPRAIIRIIEDTGLAFFTLDKLTDTVELYLSELSPEELLDTDIDAIAGNKRETLQEILGYCVVDMVEERILHKTPGREGNYQYPDLLKARKV